MDISRFAPVWSVLPRGAARGQTGAVQEGLAGEGLAPRVGGVLPPGRGIGKAPRACPLFQRRKAPQGQRSTRNDVYRQSRPFVFQADETVHGEFVAFGEVAERARRRHFVPMAWRRWPSTGGGVERGRRKGGPFTLFRLFAILW
jgi:hypothetical protein